MNRSRICIFIMSISTTFRTRSLLLSVAAVLLACGQGEPEPVDVFPEDMCAFCRMAVSRPAFAAEVITDEGEVYKFDDIGCLDRFREQGSVSGQATIFYVDYESGRWIAGKEAVIVTTGLKTPMASGKIAVADSVSAARILAEYPVVE